MDKNDLIYAYHGTNVSKGVAIGKVFIYKAYKPAIIDNKINKVDIEKELQKFKKAKELACAELDEIIDKMTAVKDDKADIFVAHKMLVLDPDMGEEVENNIKDGNSMSFSLDKVIKEYVNMMLLNDSELMRERAFDLKDIENRMLRCSEGVKECNLSTLTEPVIIVSHDLGPSDTATLNKKMVLGIITEIGGNTSHSAIIARSYEIPAILGVKDICSILKNGDEIILDGMHGDIYTNYSNKDIEKFKKMKEDYLKEHEEIKKYIDKEPISLDNKRISIKMNVANTKPEELAYAKYVDGCGLFRTEFIFMGRDKLPTEDEQFEIYKKVLLSFKSVIIRTLDIGGDKKLDCMDLPKEDNPFLGERALRLCLSHPDIFRTQIRAILRASVYGKCAIMFPMVGTLDDVHAAKEFLSKTEKELDDEGIEYDKKLLVGVMIEIPSIALVADKLAKEVDFASIGTNDLCQYSLAVDRLNPNVSKYYQMFNPGVLRLIKYAVEQFNAQGKFIGVCGEMGGNPLSAAVLVGFGMKMLSMSSSNIARVKKMIICNKVENLEKISRKIVDFSTSDEIEDYLRHNVQ